MNPLSKEDKAEKAALFREISGLYEEEYYSRAHAQRKGLWGGLNRFFSNSKTGKLEDSKMILPILGPTLIVMKIPAAEPFGALVAVTTAAITVPAAITANRIVWRETNKNIKRDFDSGVLIQRYADEVLSPKAARLHQDADNLSQKVAALKAGGLSAAFGNGTTPDEPPKTAAPVANAPKRSTP